MHTSKTHSGAKKRFKITGSGKILRSHANKNHILNKKSRKRKRNLRKRALVDSSDMKRITKLII